MIPEIQGLIDSVKKSGHLVHKIELGGIEYIYRSINRLEWREFQKSLSEKLKSASPEGPTPAAKEDGEDEIVMRALLSPKLSTRQEILSMPAGVVTQLADFILRASGFVVAEESVPVKL